jgi:hypothetical protein
LTLFILFSLTYALILSFSRSLLSGEENASLLERIEGLSAVQQQAAAAQAEVEGFKRQFRDKFRRVRDALRDFQLQQQLPELYHHRDSSSSVSISSRLGADSVIIGRRIKNSRSESNSGIGIEIGIENMKNRQGDQQDLKRRITETSDGQGEQKPTTDNTEEGAFTISSDHTDSSNSDGKIDDDSHTNEKSSSDSHSKNNESNGNAAKHLQEQGEQDRRLAQLERTVKALLLRLEEVRHY